MRFIATFLSAGALFLCAPLAALACAPPPVLLQAPAKPLIRALEQDSAPYLAAMDAYAAAMENCYDGPLGPLELSPIVQASEKLTFDLAAARKLAEDNVRGDEFAYEALLSSPLWADLEALRVAADYGAAWGQLALAVRQVAAEDKKQALLQAQNRLTQLGFEFKHPLLVQRAMYGLATAQIESGQVSQAKATLGRLQSSLQRGGAADFTQAVSAFLARISAPDYRPPSALFAVLEKKEKPGRRFTGGGMAAVEMARQALREARPAAEIAALLKPALTGGPESARAGLALAARDQTILAAMDYEPGPSLRVMALAFQGQKFGQVIAAWTDIKPYYGFLPDGLRRQTDYQMGVARLNLGALDLAIDHLTAAQKGLMDGDQKTRLKKLVILARLSVDKPPTDARLALAKIHMKPPKKVELQRSVPLTPAEVLDNLLDLRARIVLARHASATKNWTAADKYLTGIGPDEPAYRLFLGMRIRLLAEAIKGRKAAGTEEKALQLTGRGAHILYRLWRQADCPPDCLRGNDVAVHRAAIMVALESGLDSTAFGFAWGGFVEAGGDIAPLVERAIMFLVQQADTERLMALLEPSDELLAAQILAQWKAHLIKSRREKTFEKRYGWLANGLPDLQGRPKAVLLENLVAYDLAATRPDRALAHAEVLAAAFPRRPAAWFYRAAALAANQRHLEAARALAALAQRTPATDPVGMGARLGMAALFVELERGEQACAMRRKIFSRPQAATNWRDAVKAFPLLDDWDKATAACTKQL